MQDTPTASLALIIIQFFDNPGVVSGFNYDNVTVGGSTSDGNCQQYPYIIAPTHSAETNGPGLTGIAYHNNRIIYQSHMFSTMYVIEAGLGQATRETTPAAFRSRLKGMQSYNAKHFVDLQVWNGTLYALTITGDLMRFGGGGGPIDPGDGGGAGSGEGAAAIYTQRNCFACHGGDYLGGATGVNLSNMYLHWKPWEYQTESGGMVAYNFPIINPAYIKQSILDPEVRAAPQFAGADMPELTGENADQEAEILANFIFQMQPNWVRQNGATLCSSKNFINTCMDNNYLLLCNAKPGNTNFASDTNIAPPEVRLSQGEMRVVPCNPALQTPCRGNNLHHNDQCN